MKDYMPAGYESRSEKAVRLHFTGTVSPQCFKWGSAVKQVEDLNESGTNADQAKEKAQEIFKSGTWNEKGVGFDLFGAYEVLKTMPKWRDQMENKESATRGVGAKKGKAIAVAGLTTNLLNK
jgi:hypothetical protein